MKTKQRIAATGISTISGQSGVDSHGDSTNRSNSGGSRFSPRRSAGDALGRAAAAAWRNARANRHQHGPDLRRSIGPGAGRADGHAGGEPERRGDSARRVDADHRADGSTLPHHSLEFRGQPVDDRHVRSTEVVDHRRASQFPRLRHPGDGLHREGDGQGARTLLRGGWRERRDVDRRHGAGRRPCRGGSGAREKLHA